VNRAWIAAGEVFSVVCMTTSIFSIDAPSDFSVDMLEIVLEKMLGVERIEIVMMMERRYTRSLTVYSYLSATS